MMKFFSSKTTTILITLCLSGMSGTKEIRVAVASDNNHKIEAVQESFTQRFPTDTIHILNYTANSDIARQPVGKTNAKLGIQNRLQHLISKISETDYYVAIESYIEHMPHGNSWKDVALVVIIDNQTQERTETVSAPTFIPSSYVQKAHDVSLINPTGYSVTVGEIIKQLSSYPIDNHDWHVSPEFGGVSRTILMKDALLKALHKNEINEIKKQLAYYPDFPKQGVLFVDFFPVLRNPETLQLSLELLYERYAHQPIDVIVGLETRGFLMGAMLAARLEVGFVPARKPGKLPVEVYSCSYEKEYGHDTITLTKDSLQPGQRVLIVDDLIATGNSARATISLVRQANAIPIGFVSLLNVPALTEQAKLDIPAFNLID